MRKCSLRSWAVVCVGTVALAASTAMADGQVLQTGQSVQSVGVNGYCDYTWGATSSEVVRKLYPQLFLSGGLLTTAESFDVTRSAGSGSDTLWRVQAGLSYSLADFKEGRALRERARAECTVYEHQSELFAFLRRYDEPESVPGTSAKIQVLQDALPEAERILQNVRDLSLRQQATVEEVNAVGLRVASLRSELGASRARVAAAERAHPVSAKPAKDVLLSYETAVAELAKRESTVRLSRRYDVFLRAGYDRLFGVREGIPLAATLTFTFSPGSLAQPRAEEQAQQGRSAWATGGVEGIYDRVVTLLSRLRALLDVQAQRSAETAVLLADLEARYKAVQKIEGDSVRPYRDYLWFDLVRMRAEAAYLRAQTDELRTLLASETQPGSKP